MLIIELFPLFYLQLVDVYQFQPKIKTFIRKLESILIKLYRQNVSLLFNQTCLNIYIYIYIYIYI